MSVRPMRLLYIKNMSQFLKLLVIDYDLAAETRIRIFSALVSLNSFTLLLQKKGY